jgi:hypothetical protein
MVSDVQLRRSLMQACGGMSLAHAIALHALETRTNPWDALAEVVDTLERAANREPSLDSQVTQRPQGSAA